MKPIQQGRLDNLCAVYSAINLRLLKEPDRGTLANEKFGQRLFQNLINDIHNEKDGDIKALLKEGIDPDPGQLLWMLEKAGLEVILSYVGHAGEESHDPLDFKTVQSAWEASTKENARLLIFFRIPEDDEPLENWFNHYTIVTGLTESSLPLFDSYGFDEIYRNGSKLYLAGEKLEITHTFVVR